MMFGEVKGVWKEAVMALWCYYSGVRLERLRETTKKLCP